MYMQRFTVELKGGVNQRDDIDKDTSVRMNVWTVVCLSTESNWPPPLLTSLYTSLKLCLNPYSRVGCFIPLISK